MAHVWTKIWRWKIIFFISIQVSQGLAHFEVWDYGGPGIGMFCLRYSDLQQGSCDWQGESPGRGTTWSRANCLFCLQIHSASTSPTPQLGAWRAPTGWLCWCGSWELVEWCCKNTGLVANTHEKFVATVGSLLKCVLRVKGFLALTLLRSNSGLSMGVPRHIVWCPCWFWREFITNIKAPMVDCIRGNAAKLYGWFKAGILTWINSVTTSRILVDPPLVPNQQYLHVKF